MFAGKLENITDSWGTVQGRTKTRQGMGRDGQQTVMEAKVANRHSTIS